jgi:hypothetical protein
MASVAVADCVCDSTVCEAVELRCERTINCGVGFVAQRGLATPLERNSCGVGSVAPAAEKAQADSGLFHLKTRAEFVGWCVRLGCQNLECRS